MKQADFFATVTVHERLDFTRLFKPIQTFRARYPQTSGVFIENRANGIRDSAVGQKPLRIF